MHHSKQKCSHSCFEWYIVGYGTSEVWDLWDWSITLGKDEQLHFVTSWGVLVEPIENAQCGQNIISNFHVDMFACELLQLKINISPETDLIAKTYLPKTYPSDSHSFWTYVHRTAAFLRWSVQTIKTMIEMGVMGNFYRRTCCKFDCNEQTSVKREWEYQNSFQNMCTTTSWSNDRIHKYHDAFVPYPAVHIQNRIVHISVINSLLWGMEHVHCGFWFIV